MTIHFDEDGAKVDDEFVHFKNIKDTGIRILTIKTLNKQHFFLSCTLYLFIIYFGGLSIILWLPAPIENFVLGPFGAIFIALGWYKLKNPKPGLTVSAGFPLEFRFESKDKEQVERFRAAIETAMAANRKPSRPANSDVQTPEGAVS